MDLREFESALEGLIGRPSYIRPCVCDGSPLTCSVFIVGANAATSMSRDFWDFWQPDDGFQKTAWFEAYKLDRANQPLKAGRTRRNPVSNTRRVIDWVVESARPARCLETNIYATPTTSLSELLSTARSTEVFDLLVTLIKPRLIVAHGQDATNHFADGRTKVEVLAVDHFSRGWWLFVPAVGRA